VTEIQLIQAQKPRILFVCTGNTCRSVLAEYITRRKFGASVEATSAGIRPGSIGDMTNAVYMLKRLLNIDASGHRPRDVREVDLEAFELLVAMDNHVARELLQLFPALPLDRLIRWRIKDPYGDDLAEYEHCAQAVYKELKKLPMLKVTK